MYMYYDKLYLSYKAAKRDSFESMHSNLLLGIFCKVKTIPKFQRKEKLSERKRGNQYENYFGCHGRR